MPLNEDVTGGPETFGSVLRRERVRRRLSQADLAQQVGVTAGYISLIERTAGKPGAPKVGKEIVENIAEAIGFPPHEMLPLAGHHAPNPVANTDAEIDVVRLPDGRTVTIVGLAAPREDRDLVKSLIRRIMQTS